VRVAEGEIADARFGVPAEIDGVEEEVAQALERNQLRQRGGAAARREIGAIGEAVMQVPYAARGR
jgi:hypothetical protein